jgi:hypothetical protein
VADLAKMFSSSKLDIMNSMRRNRNACKELDVSVSEILKTFVDSSDINTSNVRQMPVRQKGKQMDSTSRVTKGRIHVQDERNRILGKLLSDIFETFSVFLIVSLLSAFCNFVQSESPNKWIRHLV